MIARVPDAEFIELWQKYQSPARLAEILKVDVRNINARRRRLEIRHNVQLNGGHANAKRYPSSPLPKSPRLSMDLTDGVAIIFSDCHYWPGIISTAHRALVKFVKELQPKLIVCNGDAFDGARISRWPHGEMFDSRPQVVDELRACKERLLEVAEAAPARSVRIWTFGNHDMRLEARLASMVPEFGGVSGFHLKDHFPDWTPTMSLWINGDTICKHRYKSGSFAVFNNTVQAGKNIFTGHLHNLKVEPFNDYGPTRFGVDTGMLADPDGPQFLYAEDNPKNWRSGFQVATFHKGTLLWPEPVHVLSEGLVQFRGRVYAV